MAWLPDMSYTLEELELLEKEQHVYDRDEMEYYVPSTLLDSDTQEPTCE